MLRFRLKDLNEPLRRQAEAQLSPHPRPKPASKEPPAAGSEAVMEDYSPKTVAKPPMKDSRGTPNKTEADYNRTVLGGMGRFEAVTLRTPGGNYTPDFMTIDDGEITFHECKGDYRLPSESRATLAFFSAAAAFPFWRFVWAVKTKKGGWKVKRVIRPPKDVFAHTTPTQTREDDRNG